MLKRCHGLFCSARWLSGLNLLIKHHKTSWNGLQIASSQRFHPISGLVPEDFGTVARHLKVAMARLPRRRHSTSTSEALEQAGPCDLISDNHVLYPHLERVSDGWWLKSAGAYGAPSLCMVII